MTPGPLLQQYLVHPAIGLTLRATFLSMVLQLLIGLPVGLYLAGRKNLWRAVSEIMVTLPMIFPPMALGFFLLLLLGKNGLIGHFFLNVFHLKIIFSFWGVLVATFIVGLPFMAKSVQAARQQLDNSLIEAASTLGKTRWQITRRVVLPNIRNGILAGVLLSFGRSVGEVGITLMLGGNIIGRTETLSLAIYNAVFEGEFKQAAIFSVILSILSILILFVLNFINRNKIPNFSMNRK